MKRKTFSTEFFCLNRTLNSPGGDLEGRKKI
jgi:hypothetical protein